MSKNKMCMNQCGREAKYYYKGRISANQHHDLCLQCFRDQKNSTVAQGISRLPQRRGAPRKMSPR